MSDEASPDRMQNHVATRLEKIPFSLNQLPLEAALQHVPDAVMPPVPPLRIDAVQILDENARTSARSSYRGTELDGVCTLR